MRCFSVAFLAPSPLKPHFGACSLTLQKRFWCAAAGFCFCLCNSVVPLFSACVFHSSPVLSLTLCDISLELKFREQIHKKNGMTCIYVYIRVFVHENQKPEKIKKVLECDVFFLSLSLPFIRSLPLSFGLSVFSLAR